MKKFSVLLLIIVLSVPLIVYGVYGLVSNNNSSKLSMPDEPNSVIKTLDEPTPPDTSETPKFPNPFHLEIVPNGVRGSVLSIDTGSKVIHLKEAHYFSPITQKNEVTDFTIYFNNSTKFIKDLELEGSVSDVLVGEEIICGGNVDFNKKEIKYASNIFTGRLLPKDFIATVPCMGSIEELDRDNKSFVLDFSMYEGLSKITVYLTESTVCYSEKVNVENSLHEIGKGIIPDFVHNGSQVGATVLLRQGEDRAYAEAVEFIED